tara:strand:- start:1171 stop:1326 length:156 start_codon:yes stop_codon:yes gene_type:complete
MVQGRNSRNVDFSRALEDNVDGDLSAKSLVSPGYEGNSDGSEKEAGYRALG